LLTTLEFFQEVKLRDEEAHTFFLPRGSRLLGEDKLNVTGHCGGLEMPEDGAEAAGEEEEDLDGGESNERRSAKGGPC
jgi:hypothetical protein